MSAVLYPAVEPYESGLLEVSDGQSLYWETVGNPAGIPVLYLHGGPGTDSASGTR
ncbi:MAG: prolyl aminopeptidase, partial [Rhodococcus sp. (in: high G+C Gram-positive bacteria)]